jgi:hypothetical protein
MNDFIEIEKLIKDGSIDLAQQKLDDINERTAEWHYLQSVVFYKKNWTNESKKQLEIAMNMEPYNTKYSTAYEKLKKKMEYNENQFRSGNANYTANDPNNNQRQMGGDGCGQFCECCATYCAVNMLCNMCCR